LDLINLAENSEKWRAFVNKVTKLRVPQNAGNFFTTQRNTDSMDLLILMGFSFWFLPFGAKN